MKTLIPKSVLLAAGLGLLPHAFAVTIYTQDWGYALTSVRFNGSLNLVGWTGVANSQTAQPYLGIYGATGANDPYLGLGLGPNTVYFTGLTGTNQSGPGMFYTTDTSGPGSAGDSSFTDINPTLYTNLTFNVEVRNGGGNLTNYFAVQVGGNWYVDTSDLMTLYNGGYPTFTNWSMVYTNPAIVWNSLTINGTTSVTIGGPASPNLSALITGIGIVELNNPNITGTPGFNYSQIVINQGRGDFPTSPPVNSAPAVTPQTTYEGGGASFFSTFSGSPTLAYTWSTNGGPLSNGGRYSGVTTDFLTITNVNANDALPSYSVVVTNFFGSASNINLALVVNPRPSDMLYSETFPYVGPNGNLPITGVGWQGVFQGATGIYTSGSGVGHVFSYSAVPTTNIYYTTTTNDTGSSGLPFVAINPDAYPNVTFQANFTPGNGDSLNQTNVVAYWAVQMTNGNWYVAAHHIPVQTISLNNYQPYQMAFTRAATNWNTLTIGTTAASIGTQPGSNLAGDIIGAGIVIAHQGGGGGGDFNFDTFILTTNAVSVLPPTIGLSGSPYSQTVLAGGGVSFGVSATGQPPFTYGWTLNGVPLVNGGRVSGANSPTVTIANLTTADSGPIIAYVTNSVGYDHSDAYVSTTLTVNNPAVGLLYSETFPFVGPTVALYPVSSVGWVEAAPGTPNTLFQNGGGSDAAVSATNGIAGTTIFYATTATDTNQAGLPFPNIGLAYYPDLSFAVDIAPSFSSSNVTAYLAVQLNGANWYVTASALPVPTSSDSTTFTTYNTPFNAAAANWKNLTVTGSGAIIGAAASSNLHGVMSAAGLVFVYIGTGGDFDFDNFIITGSGLGGINVGKSSGGTNTLTWVGNPAINLMSTTDLGHPTWTDVPNTLGLYSFPVQLNGPQKFYRLVQH
jgi:hypothetical protein